MLSTLFSALFDERRAGTLQALSLLSGFAGGLFLLLIAVTELGQHPLGAIGYGLGAVGSVLVGLGLRAGLRGERRWRNVGIATGLSMLALGVFLVPDLDRGVARIATVIICIMASASWLDHIVDQRRKSRGKRER